MVAVWVFVSDAPHLVHDLGLGCVCGQLGQLRLLLVFYLLLLLLLLQLLLLLLIELSSGRRREILARQQQHLLMETTNYRNLRLLLASCRRSICRLRR